MKRVFSISTMLVLLCSMFSPVWAADMEMTQAASCHRMPMQDAASQHGKHASAHRCHGMGHGMGDGMEMPATDPSDPSDGMFIASKHSHSCPMNCCVEGSPQSGAAISAVSLLPPLSTSDAEFHFASITFASAGFSSHTDRGPPTA
jgi:hypothetical protein